MIVVEYLHVSEREEKNGGVVVNRFLENGLEIEDF